jgi:GNAT superfamily N-acetyltransferase
MGNCRDSRGLNGHAHAVDTRPVIDISEIAPGDEPALRAFWWVSDAARQVDVPLIPVQPFQELLAERADDRSMRRQRWIARVDGEAVGNALVVLPDLDNTEAAHLALVVHPDARRRGVGRALLTVVLRRLREQGRTHVIGDAAEPLDGPPSPGAIFAQAVGAQRALDEISRSLEVAEIPDGGISALEDEATRHSAGYELVQWVGRCPDDIVDDLAVLTGRMTTDAPMGDLDWEAEAWDRARYRDAEERTIRLGRSWVTTAARHVATGRVVAYSDIGWTGEHVTAFQWMTIVAPEHRGRRLGLLVKAANLQRLLQEAPQIQRVITWNAESNAHMIAINEALGFRARQRFGQWQLRVPP